MNWRPLPMIASRADDPAFTVAELGRAEALRLSGNSDAAIEVLQQLAEGLR